MRQSRRGGLCLKLFREASRKKEFMAKKTDEILGLRESSAAEMSSLIPPGVSRVDYVSPRDGLRDWVLAWPPDSGNLWTVVIHGHGSHGDQIYTREDIRRSWLEPFRAAGLGVFSPNLRDNAWMSPAAASDLRALLQWLRQRQGAKGFIFISGSMGGTSNLIYAVLHPEDVAAVAALGAVADLAAYHEWCLKTNGAIHREIAGAIASAYGGTPESRPDLYRDHSPAFRAERLAMPLFIAHGEKDALMPVAQMRFLASRLGDNAEYVEIPGGGHDSPLACPQATEWLDRVVSELRRA
jgi:pimeloyl-ACP methyl ester carboxylesterase